MVAKKRDGDSGTRIKADQVYLAKYQVKQCALIYQDSAIRVDIISCGGKSTLQRYMR